MKQLQQQEYYTRKGWEHQQLMRMKDDHMQNGQLKPGYNVQIAVNSEYITGAAAYPNQSDSGTLIPFLREVERGHRQKYKRIVADAGYESHDNYLYLDVHGQASFIKPVNYDYRKLYAKARSDRLQTHLFQKLVS